MLSLDDQPGSRGFMNVLSWCGGDGGLKYRGVWWQLGCRARGGRGGVMRERRTVAARWSGSRNSGESGDAVRWGGASTRETNV